MLSSPPSLPWPARPSAWLLAALLHLSPFAAHADAGASAARLNVNVATAAELAAGLKGIGAVKAERIVAHRAAHGPFASADALLKVSGIGPKTLERLRPAITVGAALEARALTRETATRAAIAEILSGAWEDARRASTARVRTVR